jgi:hypothetical protein
MEPTSTTKLGPSIKEDGYKKKESDQKKTIVSKKTKEQKEKKQLYPSPGMACFEFRACYGD